MNKDNKHVITPPPLRRQIALTYTYNGKATNDDPASYKKLGEEVERTNREDAIIQQYPLTGHAKALLKRRREKETESSEEENARLTLSHQMR